MASDVANRYARALIEGSELRVAQQLREPFREIANAYKAQKDFRSALVNPRIPLVMRVAVAREVAEKIAGSSPALVNLVGLLVENQRSELIPEVSEAFSALLDVIAKSLSLEIRSAFEVPLEEQQALTAQLRQEFGTEVRTQWVTDPSLIGGVRIRSGDKVLDNTLRSAFDAAREELFG